MQFQARNARKWLRKEGETRYLCRRTEKNLRKTSNLPFFPLRARAFQLRLWLFLLKNPVRFGVDVMIRGGFE